MIFNLCKELFTSKNLHEYFLDEMINDLYLTPKRINQDLVDKKLTDTKYINKINSTINTYKNTDIESMINTAYFISPVVDMEKLICEMMKMSNVTESQLENCGIINTPFGEQLSWKYLCYVRENPIKWTVSTHILYGGRDNITSFETIDTFAKQFNADLTVLDNCEHWFHTEEQLKLLDKWILEN